MTTSNKFVLGTAQLGMDYGIANVSGKPTKKESLDILEYAWSSDIRAYDTAPGYGSEALLGEFISTHGIESEIEVFTKIPSLSEAQQYRKIIFDHVENSITNLGCSIKFLFLHDPADSILLLTEQGIFLDLQETHPIETIGVSLYEPDEVTLFNNCQFDLAYQFPFNVLDRRFEQANMPIGKRCARSIYLQGVLVSRQGLRLGAPKELQKLNQHYISKLNQKKLDPTKYATSFVAFSDVVDYFLVGVESKQQLEEIITIGISEEFSSSDQGLLPKGFDSRWFDPRLWI